MSRDVRAKLGLLKSIVFALCIFAVIAAVSGLALVTDATAGVFFVCFGCLLGILARILQSQYQHRELLWMVDTQAEDD